MSSISIRPRLARRPALGLELALAFALFLVAGIAQGAIVPLLPRFAQRFDLSGSQTALLLALPGLATLVVSVPAGLVADRFGARRTTMWAGALLLASSLAQAVPSLTALLLGRIAFGLAFGVTWTAGLAWFADLGEGREGGRSRLGPAVTCSSVGVMAGPALAGVLAQRAGLAAPFLAIAVATAAVLLPLALSGRRRSDTTASLRDAEGAVAHDPRGDQRSATGGAVGHHAPSQTRALKSILRRPQVLAAAGALVVSGAVSSSSQLLVSTGLHGAGLSTGAIGLAFSVASISYILVSAGIVRLGARAQTLRFNALTTALLAVALAPAVFGAGAGALVAALLLISVPRAAIGTSAYSLASAGRADGQRSDGLVFGVLNGAWALATVLMPMVAGAVQQGAGFTVAYLAVIVLACAIAALVAVTARSSKRETGRQRRHGPALRPRPLAVSSCRPGRGRPRRARSAGRRAPSRWWPSGRPSSRG
ncbi:MAG: MFS transporter [Solirubrobacteraceae bacterium]